MSRKTTSSELILDDFHYQFGRNSQVSKMFETTDPICMSNHKITLRKKCDQSVVVQTKFKKHHPQKDWPTFQETFSLGAASGERCPLKPKGSHHAAAGKIMEKPWLQKPCRLLFGNVSEPPPCTSRSTLFFNSFCDDRFGDPLGIAQLSFVKHHRSSLKPARLERKRVEHPILKLKAS